MTGFKLLQANQRPDGSTAVRFRAALDPVEFVQMKSAIVRSASQWQPRFELLGELWLPRETAPGGKVPFLEIPDDPTGVEVDAVARFQPVNAETVKTEFEGALRWK